MEGEFDVYVLSHLGENFCGENIEFHFVLVCLLCREHKRHVGKEATAFGHIKLTYNSSPIKVIWNSAN